MRMVPSSVVGLRRQGEQHGKEHEPRPVRGRHEEGPDTQLARAYTHAHPAWMGARPQQLEHSEQDEHQGPEDAHGPGRCQGLDPAHQRDHERDRRGMAERDGGQRLHDRLPALVLKAARDREEPAHPRVHAVVGAEQRERDPGPGGGHG